MAQPGNVGQRLQDPTVTSDEAAKYTKRGAYAWHVTITVRDVQAQPSWIIQKIVADDPETDTTFWEAFPVAANQAAATNTDSYQGNHRTNSGTVAIAGLMQHHVFGGGNPPGMRIGGSEYCDKRQMATDTQPPFWVDGGTAHNLDFSWGGGEAELTTEPASGAAVEVDNYTQVGAR